MPLLFVREESAARAVLVCTWDAREGVGVDYCLCRVLSWSGYGSQSKGTASLSSLLCLLSGSKQRRESDAVVRGYAC